MKSTTFFSLRALQIFSYVAKHRNFTKAAAEMHISQSAVSHQIKKLELDLNTPLIVRKNKTIALTDAGRILNEAVTDSFDTIYKTIDKITSSKRQSVTIRVTPTFGRYWLSPLLPKLWHTFADIEIIVYYATPNAQSDITVDMDIIWVDTHTQQTQQTPNTAILMHDKQVPICKKGYLNTHHITTYADLQKAVLLYEGHKNHWKKWGDMVRFDIHQCTGHCLDDFSSIMFFVSQGEGIALARLGFLKHILSTEQHDIVSPDSITNRGYYAIHRNPYTQDSPTVNRIYDFITQTAAQDNTHILQLLSGYPCLVHAHGESI